MDEDKKTQAAPLTGPDYHKDALEKNERGNFQEALTITDRAMLSYKLEGSKEFLSIFALRCLIMRRIAKETNSEDFLIAAKNEIEAGLEIGRKGSYPGQMSTLLYHYGKLLLDYKNYEEAAKIFQEALDNFPNSTIKSRSAEADFRANLETTKLILGDVAAEERAIAAINDIKNAGDGSEHELHVWMATGYLRLAEALATKDKNKALGYISQAAQIVDIDPVDLKLVKGDMEKLQAQIG